MDIREDAHLLWIADEALQATPDAAAPTRVTALSTRHASPDA